MSRGQFTCGGVVSTTVTVKVQLLDWPRLSLAVQTTLLWPSRKPVPEGGVQVTGKALFRKSFAVTVKVTGVKTPVHSARTSPGQASVGGAISASVTVNLQ